MISRLESFALTSVFYIALFSFYFFIVAKPTAGFVNQSFWDKGKIWAGVIFLAVVGMHIIFSSGFRLRHVTSGYVSLFFIWFSDHLSPPTRERTLALIPREDHIRTFGFMFHVVWSACILYGALFN
jgi:hypothetical protein